MTHHVNDVPGLLAEPKVFYRKQWLGETGAYAWEWINAFGHMPADERKGLLLHGGTPAQLYLAKQQRLSRDVDLIGYEHARIERVLDGVAARYEGRLFRWEEVPVEGADIDLQRFSAYFANSAGDAIPLRIEVTYLSVTLDTSPVRLEQSVVYKPLNSDDVVETLTPQAFIADKLPTLGFDTLGYRRVPDVLGHSEHIWKQLHDLSGLVGAVTDLARVPHLYEESIRARNAARGLAHPPDACLEDAWRVAMIALAAAVYPYHEDRPSDEHYVRDVEHVRSGSGRYQAHLMGAAMLLDDATRVALLARGLLAVRRREITVAELAATFAHSADLASAFAGSPTLRVALKARFDTASSPEGWDAPVSSRRLYRSRISAAITAWLAANVRSEVRHLGATGRFTFEPAG